MVTENNWLSLSVYLIKYYLLYLCEIPLVSRTPATLKAEARVSNKVLRHATVIIYGKNTRKI